MARENHTYYSDRDHPLLWVAQPLDKPVLTLENYTKWYSQYLVMPDGTVKQVDVGVIDEVMDKDPSALYVDHWPSPRLLYRMAQHLDCFIDERAIEVALGRWIKEAGRGLGKAVEEPDDGDGPEIIEV